MPSRSLRGRDAECATLRGLVAAIQSGDSRVLVLRGEAGVGKTALLDYTAGLATGFRRIEVAGVESDMELAFSGLQQLCAPLMEHLDELPDPQPNRGTRGDRTGRAVPRLTASELHHRVHPARRRRRNRDLRTGTKGVTDVEKV